MIADDVAQLGGGVLDGKIFGVSPSYDYENPAFVSFAKAFKAKSGKAPSSAMYEPNYYDQIIVLALAAVAGGANDGETIRNNLVTVANPPGRIVYSFAEGAKVLKSGGDIDYNGSSGSIDFNRFGNVSSFYGEVTPKDGSWNEVRAVELKSDLR